MAKDWAQRLWQRLSARSLDADLPAPGVPAIMDPDDPDGLVPTGTQLADLEVRIPLWPIRAEAGQSDRVDVFWSGAPAGAPVTSRVFQGPVDETSFPFPLYIDKKWLQPDAAYAVWYRVTIFNGTHTLSAPQTVTVDTRPPSYNQQLQALLLPDDLTGSITDEYLSSHGDQVELRLPSPVYLEAADRDVVDLYWSENNPPTTSVVASKTVSQAEIDAGDIRVYLPGDAIRAPDRDGNYYATYKVRDRAGNETQTFSRETLASVVLKPLPGGDLPEPEFPDAGKQGVIHCGHEPWNGIRVRVPFKEDLYALQDKVTLFWQGYETLNGRVPIPGTEGVFSDTVSAKHLEDGYMDILVEPFIPHIELIIEGSALAHYRLVKANGQSGTSDEGLVVINRKLPSGEICGPPGSSALALQAGRECKACLKSRSYFARLFRALGRGGR